MLTFLPLCMYPLTWTKCSHTCIYTPFSPTALSCRIIYNCEYIRFCQMIVRVLLECAHMCCVCTFPWAAARWLGLWLGRASVPSLTVLPSVGLRQVIKGWRRVSTEEEAERAEERDGEGREGRRRTDEVKRSKGRGKGTGRWGRGERGSKVTWLKWLWCLYWAVSNFSRGIELCMQHKHKKLTVPIPHAHAAFGVHEYRVGSWISFASFTPNLFQGLCSH